MRNFDVAAIWIMVVVAAGFGGGRRSFHCLPLGSQQQQRLEVGMTLVPNVRSLGAVCLDGSPPAYHLHRGFGSGARNWLLQFEGGGWCNDVASCLDRSRTHRGSTRLMNRFEVFSGILSNDSTMNPDFYNWNRVKLRYCDGASFAGDSKHRCHNKTTLYFRGQRIWDAIILDLLPKGLLSARKALLSGCSAGGLATFLHCDDFTRFLPNTTVVKCMSDAGFFLDVRDISGNNTIRPFFRDVVTLQGVQKNLNETCVASQLYPYQCFFPQYALTYIKTPYFILNSAYDVYQFHHIFVPPSSDPRGHWNHCKLYPSECPANEIDILQGFRFEMLKALRSFEGSKEGGMFIDSCFTHCQSETQETWFSLDSPRLHNLTIAEAVGNWFFERNGTKEVDCPYPCGTTNSTCHNLVQPYSCSSTCHNLIPSSQERRSAYSCQKLLYHLTLALTFSLLSIYQ